jgi:putative transposase
VLLHKAHVYRLYPTPEQAAVLGQWVGAVRATYNVALEQRRAFYRPGRSFTFAGQCREVTALRAEFDWLRDVPVHPLQQAVKDLQRAYERWWSALKAWAALPPGEKAKTPRPGPPSSRKRGFNDSMRFPDPATFAFRRISRRVGEVKLPKLGWVRFRWDKAVPGEVRNITVKRHAGQWFVAAQYQREAAASTPSDLPAVGIDRGVAVFAALSDGTLIEPANHGKKALKALARAQRRLARKKRGSANRRKQARRITRLHMRVANARKDTLHKLSTAIANSHGAVVLEKLEVPNMVRSAAGTVAEPGRNVRAKAGLNRAILDQGWGVFRAMLGWKLAERGGRLVEVPAQNTSRECSACGVMDAASRHRQWFRCVGCGYEAHADTNAAKNIKRRLDTPLLPVEGCRQAPREAGTSRKAA